MTNLQFGLNTPYHLFLALMLNFLFGLITPSHYFLALIANLQFGILIPTPLKSVQKLCKPGKSQNRRHHPVRKIANCPFMIESKNRRRPQNIQKIVNISYSSLTVGC